jgi:hypothetical protein
VREKNGGFWENHVLLVLSPIKGPVMARLYILLAFVLTAPVLLWAAEDAPAPTPEETTLNAVGDEAPDFAVTMLDGSTFTGG